ncbi:MAG: phosphoglucosamine mutase [Bacteroidales bacterium]|nr:phosphoglucosamine mutase [Bacteroidales bacterium]
MTLIKSISGIRGTIGGYPGENLTPVDIIKFVSAFGYWVREKITHKDKIKVVIGRDARISGEMVNLLVTGTLCGLGINVIDSGLTTTPGVEIAVTKFKADGGIILTASHNPKQWNALKLLNSNGEFLSASDGERILELAETENLLYAEVDNIGNISTTDAVNNLHIQQILDLKLVDTAAIKNANFKVAIDCVNSVGGIVIPRLLKALGVNDIVEIYCEPNGNFPHNPEPLPEHLEDISKAVVKHKANLGFVVDPDVDRLAIINEDGTMFGEDYTLVAVADYVLQHKKGNTVSNLSSSIALKEITEKHGGKYEASAVGEVNVVEKMKATKSVIGGEGNGGVIYPEIHYGRDALVGIALFLSWLAKSGGTCSQLRARYPDYVISKNKIELAPETDLDNILAQIKRQYKDYPVNAIDGVKIYFGNEWVHMRKSNTESIIRIYSESNTREKADKLAQKMISTIQSFL